jgi:hypothetical protein
MNTLRRVQNFSIRGVATMVLGCFSNAFAQGSYRVTDLGTLNNDDLGCYGVTGNPRCRLAVECSPAKRHTPTLDDPLFLPRLQNWSWSFRRGDRTFGL